ncbi:hypothetical protein HZH68_016227 [Vespula germanica]|uniref:Uncharacterized protein n=1 Tax=Vespula germanica TaxID=30212 RepID=A0A834J2C3_VESGE|nr:hypothetical protein HZH68_016227 [Vespula germanica]
MIDAESVFNEGFLERYLYVGSLSNNHNEEANTSHAGEFTHNIISNTTKRKEYKQLILSLVVIHAGSNEHQKMEPDRSTPPGTIMEYIVYIILNNSFDKPVL